MFIFFIFFFLNISLNSTLLLLFISFLFHQTALWSKLSFLFFLIVDWLCPIVIFAFISSFHLLNSHLFAFCLFVAFVTRFIFILFSSLVLDSRTEGRKRCIWNELCAFRVGTDKTQILIQKLNSNEVGNSFSLYFHSISIRSISFP